MTAEHLCLLAAQLTAADHAWHDGVCQLAWSMDIFHIRRAHLHHRITVWQLALTAAQHMMENIYLTSDALEGLGHPLWAVGRHDEARTAWREALELFEIQQRSADAERVREHLASITA
ncbi:hypothetical protein AB0I91_05880 [Actinosynnema sp. NPDC049800]